MKMIPLLSLLGLFPLAVLAQPASLPPAAGAARVGETAAIPKDTANYVITVTWTDPKHRTNSLQVLTAEGNFTLDTIDSSVRIDDNDIPTTVSLSGTLTRLSESKASLKLFLGRTVPYVTSTYSSGAGKPSSSYQQMRVGLNSMFTVTLGRRMVIQSDQNGEVSILVKRDEN